MWGFGCHNTMLCKKISFWVSYHAVQLAHYAIVVTVHLFCEMKSHGFIDLCVRLIPTTFQVALYSLSIRFLRNLFEQSFSNSFALLRRQDCDDVQEVVAARIGPKLLLDCCLWSFPNVVALTENIVNVLHNMVCNMALDSSLPWTHLDIEPASSIPQIHAHLASPEPPAFPIFPQPFSPGLPVTDRFWRHPHCYSKDLLTPSLFGNMKKCVPDAPPTANPKRDTITRKVDLCQINKMLRWTRKLSNREEEIPRRKRMKWSTFDLSSYTQRLYGSSAKASWIVVIAPWISDSVRGVTWIGIVSDKCSQLQNDLKTDRKVRRLQLVIPWDTKVVYYQTLWRRS